MQRDSKKISQLLDCILPPTVKAAVPWLGLPFLSLQIHKTVTKFVLCIWGNGVYILAETVSEEL
jgi:hypothetical protein